MTRAFRAAGPALLAALLAACEEPGVVTQGQVPGGDPRRGEVKLAAYGCGSCHTIPGVPLAEGLVGPPLVAFAERTYIAGRVRNEPANLVRWIRDPQSIDSLTVMPNLGVVEADARDMAAYLYTLAPGRLGPPHPIPERVLHGK